ncbi:SDR family oxidoreductase [Bacteroidota bacterium]
MKKVVLITGATSGIGKAIAEFLASYGYKVYGTGRNIKNAIETDELKFLYIDVRDEITIDKAIDHIIKKEKKIEVLINNAGIGIAGSLEEIPFNEIYNTYETNFFGMIRMIKKVTPFMRENGGGLIINISSIAGRIGLPFQSIYSSSKFALESVTEALSIELNNFGIKVCMVEPGDYNTNVNQNRVVIKPDESSPYSKRLKGFFNLLIKNINNGRDPSKINRLILKIIKAKNPKLRYKSGKILETLTPFVKFIIPDRMFEKILMKFYNI